MSEAVTFEQRKAAYLNQANAEAGTLTASNAIKAYGALDVTNTFKSYGDGKVAGRGPLSLVDPIRQLANRVSAFFENDPDVIVVSNIDNFQDIGPDEDVSVALNIYVKTNINHSTATYSHTDLSKAVGIGNLINRDMVFREEYVAPDDTDHARNHHLIVKVFACGAITPSKAAELGLQAAGDEESPIWEVPALTTEQIAERTEDSNWEDFKNAFKGNGNIVTIKEFEHGFGLDLKHFVECTREPVTWQEDNLCSLYGYNSALAVDLLKLIFPVVSELQLSTYARPNNTKGAWA